MSIGAQALQAHGRWRGLAVRSKGRLRHYTVTRMVAGSRSPVEGIGDWPCGRSEGGGGASRFGRRGSGRICLGRLPMPAREHSRGRSHTAPPLPVCACVQAQHLIGSSAPDREQYT